MCLTREQFRSMTFERDGNTCVVPGCGNPAVDPHHIIDRALWLKDDPCPEGYLLANGASLCEFHHIHAEENYYPPQALRRWLSLPTALPRQLDAAKIWNKWGNEIPVAPNNKWPRTPYLSVSPSIDPGDETIEPSAFLNKPLVVTIKMDGANVTLTRDKVTSRNGDTASHPQFAPLKALHAGFKHLIPEGVIVYGEWLFAKHSIHYTGPMAIPSPFLVFAVYEPAIQLLWSWQETVEFCENNGFQTVPVVGYRDYDAEWKFQTEVWKDFEQVTSAGHEGIVIRNTYPVHQTQWPMNAAKMVRENHVQTGDDWKTKVIVKNEVQSA